MGNSAGTRIFQKTERENSYFEDQLANHLNKVRQGFTIANVVITEEHKFLARKSWTIIVSGENTEPFNQKKLENPDSFSYSSSLTWFYDSFYSRFFELCPEAKPMFTNVSMIKQGRLVAGVLSSALDTLDYPQKLRDRLVLNTERHNGKGIKSEMYTTMGDALIWALELVIGPTFDAKTKQAWVHIYSYLLSIILPVSAGYEVKSVMAKENPNAPEQENSNHTERSVSKRISKVWSSVRLDSFFLSKLDQFDGSRGTSSPKSMSPSPKSITHMIHMTSTSGGDTPKIMQETTQQMINACPNTRNDDDTGKASVRTKHGKCPF